MSANYTPLKLPNNQPKDSGHPKAHTSKILLAITVITAIVLLVLIFILVTRQA